MRTASRWTSAIRASRPTMRTWKASNTTVRLEYLGRHRFLHLEELRPHRAIGDRTPLSLIHPPRQHIEAPIRPDILSWAVQFLGCAPPQHQTPVHPGSN